MANFDDITGKYDKKEGSETEKQSKSSQLLVNFSQKSRDTPKIRENLKIGGKERLKF